MFGGAAASAVSSSSASASPFSTLRGTPGVPANPADTLPSPPSFDDIDGLPVAEGESPFAPSADAASPFAAAAAPAMAASAGTDGASPGWGGGDVSRASTYVGPDDDLVPAGQSPVRAMIATLLGSRRNIALVAGGALLLVILLAFAMGGSKAKPKAVAGKSETTKKAPVVEPARGKTADEKVAETPAESDAEKVAAVEARVPAETPDETPAPGSDTTAAGSDATAVEPAAGAGSAAIVATGTPKTPTTGTGKVVTGGKAGTGSKKTLGGKQVVLEYDAQAKETAKPAATAPKNDQAAVLKARASYAQGNQRLMAGDWNGAIIKYRQSLASYPGYVAGYRGLGLAFMQKGDKPKALQALRLYLSSVPTAKDASLIRKRIETLQK
jgi:hypothetical protein